MTDVASLTNGLQALLHARGVVVRAAGDDVPRLFAGLRLRRLDTRLAEAAAQVRAGADQVAGTSGSAADAARHAADLLDGARAATTDRATWNASRPALSQVRDVIDAAIVDVRGASPGAGSLDDRLAGTLVRRARSGEQLAAEEWDHLAELASLPDGIRSTRLLHMTSEDVAKLRDQASRIREGLEPRIDRDLRGSLHAAALSADLPDRAAAEQKLERVADKLLSVRAREIMGDTSELLADVDALRRLDPSLRPRGIERLDGIEWSRASEMAGRGTRLPEQWDGWPALRAVSKEHRPQDSLRSLADRSIADFTPKQWRELAELVSIRGDARPDALAGFTQQHGRDLRIIAGRIERGHGIPAGWDGLGPLSTLRADVLWPDRAHANARMVDILGRRPADIGAHELYDLDAMRRLPDAIRPELLDPSVETWAKAAESGRSAAEQPEVVDALVDLNRQALESPNLAREALDRINGHVALLEAAEQKFSGNGQVPRKVVQTFDADLQTLRAFEWGAQEQQLLENAQELVQRNIRRMDRELVDSYPGHVDYADLGRIRASIELLTSLVRSRLPVDAPAQVVDDTARVADGILDDAAETLSW